MKMLIDAQLPRRLARWLAQQGHDAVHTLDLRDRNRTPDASLITMADNDGRVVVTKDSDFTDSFLIRRKPAKLLLISTGNMSNDELLQLFALHLPMMVVALESSSFVELTSSSLVVRE